MRNLKQVKIQSSDYDVPLVMVLHNRLLEVVICYNRILLESNVLGVISKCQTALFSIPECFLGTNQWHY